MPVIKATRLTFISAFIALYDYERRNSVLFESSSNPFLKPASTKQ